MNHKPLIGIITIQGRYNYGNRLQNYATAKIYINNGCQPVSLILNRKPSLRRRLELTAKALLGGDISSPESRMSADRLAAFDRFNEYIDFETVESIHSQLLEKYDYFSAGSDQIWILGRSSFGEDWRFLQFAPPEKRIALAPSLGIDSMPPHRAKRLKRYLRDYERISVREESGAQLIKSATGLYAQQICDPTMALSVKEWEQVCDNRLTPKYPYILSYILGEEGHEVEIALSLVNNRLNVPVIRLSDRERPGEPPAGPGEFLSLIRNASHVVTDSFHGAIFSSIFQVPLTITHREAPNSVYGNMFGRLESLVKALGIEDKVIDPSKPNVDAASYYDGVERSLERERSAFYSFLCECIRQN